jgi:glycosyltransferase involved in cell wall biosynthesis
MKVLALVPSIYDTSPGQRFRIEQWEPMLRDLGVEITYAPFETEELRDVLYQPGHMAKKVKTVLGNMSRRSKELSRVNEYDLVYVFREAAILGPPWFERKVANAGVPMIFDFDDAVFIAYRSPSNGYLSYLKFPQKTAEICRLASHVMAGNQYLADYAGKYNSHVTIVPTTIDIEKYQIEDRPSSDVITIGWSGSYSTAQHLDTVREALIQLAKEERFRLRVIGAPDYKLDGVDVDAIKWKSDTEVEDLRKIDIGIMPLPDDAWSKGKCGLKALQYMALGVPTICSPVGVNSTIIQDGENGFIADSQSEWIEKLKRLIHSEDLRRKLGDAGRATVERKYSPEIHVPRVFEIFESAVRKAGATV